MHVIESVDAFRAARRGLVGRVAFVPTMGALHEGHLSLMRFAREHADHLVVSVFVNPTQFGPNEDLAVYPRDRDGDIAKCEAMGCELMFFPPVGQMYPDGKSQATFVEVDCLTSGLCGAARPGHFRGVTTVVTKLFNIVQPDVAVFGQKDYQQFAVLRQMARDLNMPIEVISAPTVREADGLAMSSRNVNLRPDDRGAALSLSRGLMSAWQAWAAGERDPLALEATAVARMEEAGVRVDYAHVVDPQSLVRLAEVSAPAEAAVLAVAGFVGAVRLIDNLRLDAELPEGLRGLE